MTVTPGREPQAANPSPGGFAQGWKSPLRTDMRGRVELIPSPRAARDEGFARCPPYPHHP